MIVGWKGISSQQYGLDEKCSHRLKSLYIWSLAGSTVGDVMGSFRCFLSAEST